MALGAKGSDVPRIILRGFVMSTAVQQEWDGIQQETDKRTNAEPHLMKMTAVAGQGRSGTSLMATVYIAYPGDKNTRFDRAYYADKHLPLVMECWGEYGLQTLAVFYPDGDGRGLIAICVCVFRDDDAVEDSFRSERTSEVMADIARFTDSRPWQQRSVPLSSSQ